MHKGLSMPELYLTWTSKQNDREIKKMKLAAIFSTVAYLCHACSWLNNELFTSLTEGASLVPSVSHQREDNASTSRKINKPMII